MRVCTQCGHKLSAEEYLCPTCDLWNSNAYCAPATGRRAKTLATVFVGPFQMALVARQLCAEAGIPAWVDAARGAALSGDGATVRVRVPAERADEASDVLSRAGAVAAPSAPHSSDPTLRRKRHRLRARLSLRRRAYQSLAWSIAALLVPPAGLFGGWVALKVLTENRGLPVVTEETRVARAALVISTAAMAICAALVFLFVKA
jgi:hypothetical protein